MKALLVKTTHDHLERFLLASTDVANVWDVSSNDPAFDEHVEARPLTVEELLTTIRCYAPDSDYLYVFSDEATPLDSVSNADLESIPEVTDKTLGDYIIRAVRGSDYLWVACSQEQASNGDYITILPAREHES